LYVELSLVIVKSVVGSTFNWPCFLRHSALFQANYEARHGQSCQASTIFASLSLFACQTTFSFLSLLCCTSLFSFAFWSQIRPEKMNSTQ
jgi:hypothetical protein